MLEASSHCVYALHFTLELREVSVFLSGHNTNVYLFLLINKQIKLNKKIIKSKSSIDFVKGITAILIEIEKLICKKCTGAWINGQKLDKIRSLHEE